MNPCSGTSRRCCTSPPRACGDGPCPSVWNPRIARRSPCTRGCPRPRDAADARHPLLPALAEIPGGRPSPHPSAGLSPIALLARRGNEGNAGLAQDPWAVASSPKVPVQLTCSVYAGMSPPPRRSPSTSPTAPRTRRDAPPHAKRRSNRLWRGTLHRSRSVPPSRTTWGYPRPAHGALLGACLFPAHAGMNPSSARPAATSRPAPRAWGMLPDRAARLLEEVAGADVVNVDGPVASTGCLLLRSSVRPGGRNDCIPARRRPC